MTYHFPCSSTARRFVAGITIALSALGQLNAQTLSGSVTGRISDSFSGRSLQGAVVQILDANAIVSTDVDGRPRRHPRNSVETQLQRPDPQLKADLAESLTLMGHPDLAAAFFENVERLVRPSRHWAP